jgi:hypothetical protein
MKMRRKSLFIRLFLIVNTLFIIPGACVVSYLNITFTPIFIFAALYLPLCYGLGQYGKVKGMPVFLSKFYTFFDRHLTYRPFDHQTHEIETTWRQEIEKGEICHYHIPSPVRLFPDRCYLQGVSFIMQADKSPLSFKAALLSGCGLLLIFTPLLLWEFPEQGQKP